MTDHAPITSEHNRVEAFLAEHEAMLAKQDSVVCEYNAWYATAHRETSISVSRAPGVFSALVDVRASCKYLKFLLKELEIANLSPKAPFYFTEFKLSQRS